MRWLQVALRQPEPEPSGGSSFVVDNFLVRGILAMDQAATCSR